MHFQANIKGTEIGSQYILSEKVPAYGGIKEAIWFLPAAVLVLNRDTLWTFFFPVGSVSGWTGEACIAEITAGSIA